MGKAAGGARSVVDLAALGSLIPSLERRGFQVVGPTLRDGAIVYDSLSKLEDLPIGWTDEQEAGQYRLKRRDDGALFGYNVGPQSWKNFLHPSRFKLFDVNRENGDFRIVSNGEPSPRYAFLGLRACELAAIGIQDRVLIEDRFTDPIYQSRRQGLFVVAVNCTQSAATCFCASMDTGPRSRKGFDLALTEIIEPERHVFLVESGSAAGLEVLRELKHAEASKELCRKAEELAARAASAQTRRLDTANIRDLLYENFYHPRWDDVARRCLSCANCTMVCPTCFCVSVEDSSDVTGDHAERWRRWDSCFSQTFSYIHGGSVRTSAKSRYRQWMTHKLASWMDQFGSSGCVGCGRCITWCPAGIDITEEARAIRENPMTPAAVLMEEDNGNA